MRKSKLLTAAVALAIAFGLSLVTVQAAKTHSFRAEVVAVDAKSQSITFKEGEQGTTRTLPVESGAAQFIAELEPGDQVILTCRGDDDGKLLAVTGIKKG